MNRNVVEVVTLNPCALISSPKRNRLITLQRAARAAIGATIEALEARQFLSITTIEKPNFIVAHGATISKYASTSTVGFTAAKVRKAYGIDSVSFNGVVGDGSGQTIAFIDAYDAPNIQADLKTFDTAMGLADTTLTVVKQSGTTTDPSGPGDSWALETSLDVEWAHAVAPGAKLLLVEASSASDAALYAAVDTARNTAGVSVISMSWGGTEASSDASYNTHFVTPSGHTPITFVASSGDSGAYSSSSAKAVGSPAVSIDVVGVGGTSLTTTSTGAYTSEGGWGNGTSSYANGGSGGGISKYTAKPTFQSTVTQSSTYRTVPDVAFLADPNTGASVYDSYDSPSDPWMAIGGTSLASPMFGGVMAIVDQGRALKGLATLDGPTQTLPMLYALSSADYHDITTGNNGYAAGTGYDLVTGLGTPIVNKFALDLAGYGTTTTVTPTVSGFTASPTSTTVGASVLLTATASETGGSISSVKFYADTDGTTGLNTATDTLLGTGTGTGTYTLSASTAALSAKTYTLYAVATDASSTTASTSTTLTLTTPVTATPTISSFTVNPTSTTIGASATLTASATETGGTISSVKFYRESNSTTGFQTTDTLIGTGTASGSTYTIATSTTGLTAGTYTYYAVATDAASATASASTTLTLTTPTTVTAGTPTISSFTVNPTSTTIGGSAVLTSSATETGGTISAVKFYRESNSTTGFQTTDTLLGSGTASGSTYTLTTSTTGLTAGTYTYYAVATDAAAVSSAASTATLAVTAPVVTTTGALAGWSVTGQTAFGTQGLKAATVDASVTNSTGLTRGTGVVTTGTAASNAWGGTSWGSTSALGISGSKTVTFGLTVATGKVVSLSSINLNYRRSSTGAANGLWQYQLNTGAWTTFADVTSEFSSTSSSGAAITTLSTASVAALQNLAAGTVVNFRLTPYGTTSTGGTWYIYDRTGNDLVVTGSASAAAATKLAATASAKTIDAPLPVDPVTVLPPTDGGSFSVKPIGHSRGETPTNSLTGGAADRFSGHHNRSSLKSQPHAAEWGTRTIHSELFDLDKTIGL